ncbi:lipase [Amycolatopsis minnesotensis]|uniref:Alpha/beta hydrolase n=1 Tax=Amycolatopsis minnesotensis TaxID=337894 RepID=A0ABP5BEJ1_9PSEU
MRRSRFALLAVVAALTGLVPATAVATTPAGGYGDWSCRPSAAHPNPVVLVHGTGDNKDYTWRTLGPLLAKRGYCAFALTYGVLPAAPVVSDVVGGLTPIEDSAAEVRSFVDEVVTATGVSKVDIVGYSQGTLVPAYYAKFLGGRERIHAYVGLAPVWQGTDPLGIGDVFALVRWLGLGQIPAIGDCGACPQVLTGSAFLAKLNEGGTFLPGIAYTNIATRYDLNIVPYTNGLGTGPNVRNIVLQDGCREDRVNHMGIVVDPNAAGHVLNALDPAHAKPVPCTPMSPLGPRR